MTIRTFEAKRRQFIASQDQLMLVNGGWLWWLWGCGGWVGGIQEATRTVLKIKNS